MVMLWGQTRSGLAWSAFTMNVPRWCQTHSQAPYLEHASAMSHHAGLVQCRLAVGQHDVTIAQVAVHDLASLMGRLPRHHALVLGPKAQQLPAQKDGA